MDGRIGDESRVVVVVRVCVFCLGFTSGWKGGMKGARSTKDVVINYVEMSMVTAKRVASSTRVAEAGVGEHGVLYACDMLDLKPGDGSSLSYGTLPFNERTTVGEYNGDFFVCLSEEDKALGFQEQLRLLKAQHQDLHTKFVDLSLTKPTQENFAKEEISILKILERQVKILEGLYRTLREENNILKGENQKLLAKIVSLESKIVSRDAQLQELQNRMAH